MSKWILLGFSLLIFNVINAQEIKADSATVLSDSSSLQSAAKDLLRTEITFSHEGGKLESVLEKLSAEQQIKISFSSDRIDHAYVSRQEFSSVPLSTLLSSLLNNTGFTYIVVGTVIVIVPAGQNSGDSTIDTTSISFDTSEVAEHVYEPEKELSVFPRKLKKHIQNIYQEEQEWAEYRRSGGSDENFKPSTHPRFEISDYGYFLSAGIGLVPYIPRIRSNSNLPWKEDLGFDRQIPSAVRAEVNAGKAFNNIFFGLGAAYQKVNAKIYYQEAAPSQGNSPQKNHKTVTRVLYASYSVVSVPAEIKVVKQKKNLFGAIGADLEFGFISADREATDAFSAYFEDNSTGGAYYEKDVSFSVSSGLKAEAGVLIYERMAASTAVQYTHYFRPFTETSLYSFYPHFLQIQLAYTYFF